MFSKGNFQVYDSLVPTQVKVSLHSGAEEQSQAFTFPFLVCRNNA